VKEDNTNWVEGGINATWIICIQRKRLKKGGQLCI